MGFVQNISEKFKSPENDKGRQLFRTLDIFKKCNYNVLLFKFNLESISSKFVKITESSMTINMKNRYFFLPTLTILPFLCWLMRYINLDFWFDEWTSLTIYIFADLKRVVTFYHAPNNHVFFNLLSNIIYTRLLKLSRTITIDYPFIIRLLPFIFMSCTLIYIYRIGKVFYNKTVAVYSLIIITTTIPFYNFVLQLRGYGLSIMLLTIMLYHILRLEKRFRWSNCLFILITGTLSLYTIPLNGYFILAANTYFLISGSINFFRKNDQYKNDFLIVLFTSISIILSLLLYSPIIKSVTNNIYIDTIGPFNFKILASTMPKVLLYFFSSRHLLVLIFLISTYLYLKTIKKFEYDKKILFLIFILFAPFTFSFIRGDNNPFHRVFINLTPVFAIIMSVFLYNAQLQISFFNKVKWLMPLFVFIYCNITFALSINHIEKKLLNDIESGFKSQNIYYNYYQAYYSPMKLFHSYAKESYKRKIPVVSFIPYEGDRQAINFYGLKEGIKLKRKKKLNRLLNRHKRVHFITAFPNKFEK